MIRRGPFLPFAAFCGVVRLPINKPSYKRFKRNTSGRVPWMTEIGNSSPSTWNGRTQGHQTDLPKSGAASQWRYMADFFTGRETVILVTKFEGGEDRREL